MNGNNILIYLGDNVIAATKSQEIQVDCDTIEISSPSSGDWRQHIVGRKSWSITVNFLVSAVGDLAKLLTVGNSYTVTIKDRSNNSYNVSGTATLVHCDEVFTRGSLSVGNYRFQGNGALS